MGFIIPHNKNSSDKVTPSLRDSPISSRIKFSTICSYPQRIGSILRLAHLMDPRLLPLLQPSHEDITTPNSRKKDPSSLLSFSDRGKPFQELPSRLDRWHHMSTPKPSLAKEMGPPQLSQISSYPVNFPPGDNWTYLWL